ncbi:UNC5C-like protein, partial [Mya arenaria]
CVTPKERHVQTLHQPLSSADVNTAVTARSVTTRAVEKVIRQIEDFFVSTVMTPYQPAGAITLTFVDQERHAKHTIRAKYSLVDGKFRTWKEGLATAVVVPHVAQVTFVMTNASRYLMANGRFGLSGQRAVQRVVKEQRQGLGLAITPLRAAVENNVLACVQPGPGNFYLAHGFFLSKTLQKSILLCIKYISSDFVNVCLTRNAKYSRCVFHLRKIYMAVDGDWGSWVGWTNCDTKCERGKQFRTRMCYNPAPLHGGANCTGEEIETIGMVWYCRYITQIVEISFCCSGIYLQNNSERIMFVFQHRVNGSVDFYQNISLYDNGFGSLQGLKLVNEMTSRTTNDLRIDIARADDSTAFVAYTGFSLGAGTDYTLHVGNSRSGSGREDPLTTDITYMCFGFSEEADYQRCALEVYNH